MNPSLPLHALVLRTRSILRRSSAARPALLWQAVIFLLWMAWGGAAFSETPPGTRRALLIGCTEYPLLKPKYRLRGPSHDVDLTQQLLVQHLGFRPDQITSLIFENPATGQPTEANIRQAFQQLVAQAQPGDEVFVLLSGHGSRQPQDRTDDTEDIEHDGFDEVFLPQDTPSWQTRAESPGTIADDEIRGWLQSIVRRGANVTFLADMCHAGTADRGPADQSNCVGFRYIPSEELTPPDVLARIAAIPSKPTDSTFELSRATDRSVASNLPAASSATASAAISNSSTEGTSVALYAVGEEHLEREHPMPPHDQPTDPFYGRLTYAFYTVVSNAPRALTHREVAQRLQWQYDQWGWDPPGYMMASQSAWDRELLGSAVWHGRSALFATRQDEDAIVLHAGQLHGVTVGSIYRLLPRDGVQGADVLPAEVFVRVEQTTPSQAVLVPCDYQGIAAEEAAALPLPATCELVWMAYDPYRLPVDVMPISNLQIQPDLPADARDTDRQPEPHDGTTHTDALRQWLQDQSDSTQALWKLADRESLAEAYVMQQGHQWELQPAFGGRQTSSRPAHRDSHTSPIFGPFPESEIGRQQLVRALQAMARASHLRRLATPLPVERSATSPEDGPIPDVALNVRVQHAPDRQTDMRPIDPAVPLQVFDGHRLRIEVTNQGAESVDVTILYLESEYRIISYYPTAKQAQRGFDNRLRPQGPPAVVELTINDSTTGLEDLLILGTQAQPGTSPQNYAFLEQPSLPTRDDRGRGLSPLQDLLVSAGYGHTDHRGTTAAGLSSFVIHRISWRVGHGPGDVTSQPPTPSGELRNDS